MSTKSSTLAMESFCAICVEDKPSLVSLTKCSHKSCSDCLVQWIEKAESAGQENLPGCPFCREELTPDETHLILDRPYQPARSELCSFTATTELDDLTLEWLGERTKPCPRCGAWIEKIEGGCDKMECLCGYRFCYGCGAQGAECQCTDDSHYFWDNILDQRALRLGSPSQEAPVAKETGHVDFAAHIARRRKWERDQMIRLQRAYPDHESILVDEIIYSARWLFLPQKAAYKMLDQVCVQEKVHEDRKISRFFAFLEEPDEFQTAYADKWLFLPPAWAYKVLEQPKPDSKHNQRRKTRALEREEEANLTPLESSARWLYCNRKTGFRMLRQQEQANQIHDSRRSSTFGHSFDTWQTCWIMDSKLPVDVMIENGSWLFRQRSSIRTREHVKRLFRHQLAQVSAQSDAAVMTRICMFFGTSNWF